MEQTLYFNYPPICLSVILFFFSNRKEASNISNGFCYKGEGDPPSHLPMGEEEVEVEERMDWDPSQNHGVIAGLLHVHV